MWRPSASGKVIVYKRILLALACLSTIVLGSTLALSATELPHDFTILYYADERGEVEPCG